MSGPNENTTLPTLTEPAAPHLLTLLQHRHYYQMFVVSETLVNFHGPVQNAIVEAYKVHDPHYHYDRNCGACVAEMLVTVYRWFDSLNFKG